MSATRSSEELVARLASDLAPVRPVPALRRQVLAVAAAFAATAAAASLWIGLDPRAAIARGGIFAALFAALALIGSGGALLGLVCRMPGRERLARGAAIGAGLGLLAVAAAGLAVPEPIADPAALAQGARCFARALLLAIPIGLIAAFVSRRGAPWRPGAAGFGLALGAVSLGSLLVHVSCKSPSPAHWLTEHALLPLAAGAAAGSLVARWLARRAERSRRALARDLLA